MLCFSQTVHIGLASTLVLQHRRMPQSCRIIILHILQAIKFVSWRPEFFVLPALPPLPSDEKRETRLGLPACDLGWMTGVEHPVAKMRRLTFLPLRCTMVSEDPDPAPVCCTEGVACRRSDDRFGGA